jgi:Flp pilus assembly protein TadD
MSEEAARVLYEQGRELLRQDRYEEAIVQFRRSAELDPHFKTLELLGEGLIQLGRFKEAIIPLAAATTLNRQSRAPSLLAKALLASGDREGARDAAQLALTRAPNNRLASEVVRETADLEQDEPG